MSTPADGAGDPGPTPKGIDLARAALMQARAQAKARHDKRMENREARRGLRRSGSGPDDRDPQRLSSVMGRLSAERGWRTPVAVHGVMDRWAEIVGPQVASYCVPERYEEGTLTVRADSATSESLVRWLARDLVRQINLRLGDGTVTYIKVLGPAGERRPRGQWRTR